MTVLYLTSFAIAVSGGAVMRWRILGFDFTYWLMAIVMLSYASCILKSAVIRLNRHTNKLLVFLLYSLMSVVLSYVGVMSFVAGDEVRINLGYIPRQAYYLVFFPAILLLYRNKQVKAIHFWIKVHSNTLFFLVYILHIIYSQSFSLFVTATFILSWLATLHLDNTGKVNFLHVLLLVGTPIARYGELTNLLLRVAFILCVVLKIRKIVFQRLFYAGFLCVVIAMFLLPFLSGGIKSHLSVNSEWRLDYWRDELLQLKESAFLGVGYGTAYATDAFVSSNTGVVFHSTEEYAVEERSYVVGSHNSFISLVFRLGVIGFLLFMIFLDDAYKALYIRRLVSDAYAFVGSVIIISFNVGLESPFYLILFIFAMASCFSTSLQRAKRRNKRYGYYSYYDNNYIHSTHR